MNFEKALQTVLTLIFAFTLAGCGGGDSPMSTVTPPAQPTPNYVNLQSDQGDYIGAGQNYSYTQANARISVSATGGHLSVTITGDQDWRGDFVVPSNLNQLKPGYYDNLKRYPFHDPEQGGLNWSGEGRGSNNLTGWFAVDKATYVNGVLTEIDLRFEQHSEGRAPALHGQIHWEADDPTVPPGPVNPPPAELWKPAPDSTPSSGNYIYLQSDIGDYIGAGLTYTYTQSNALISISETGGQLSVTITGDQQWSGYFQTMDTLGQLQPGYYGDLRRYPFHNPVKGGLNWLGEGRGSNTLTGWFVVDNVTYFNNVLTAIDLRFEQHSEGMAPALHGQIHWAQI